MKKTSKNPNQPSFDPDCRIIDNMLHSWCNHFIFHIAV